MIGVVASAFMASAQHTFFYDTYDPDDTSIKVVTDTYTLDACGNYTLTVDGSYSIWVASSWGSGCGTPDALPMYPTPGVTNGNVGFDMEYMFAMKYSSHPLCGSLPSATPRIEISLDGGSTWFHPTPISGAYNPAHVYQYNIAGAGFPIQVRHISSLNSDDYGQLRFKIDPVLADPCEFEPMANFDQVGCSVQFTDISSIPCTPGFSILGVEYDFGDGTTSTQFNPSHAYAASGAYIVSYTVWATNGETCCKQTYRFEVHAEACSVCDDIIPSADFTWSGNPTVNFSETGIAGLNPGDLVIGYSWDFGDGSYGTGSNPGHTYSASGTYTVCLTVLYYDEARRECCTATICHDVTVTVPLTQINTGGGSEVSLDNIAELNIYPNPNDGMFTVSLEDDYIESVVITSLNGAVVYKQNEITERSPQVDLSKLTSGYYLVVAHGLLGGTYTGKVMIK